MLLFLPIITDVVADSISNMVTLKISETKKLISTEEAIKPVQPSTSSSEIVKTSPNGGKEVFVNIDESLATIQGTVSGTVTSQLTTKLLDLVTLNELITQTHDYLEEAYGLTVAFVIGLFASIDTTIRKVFGLPVFFLKT